MIKSIYSDFSSTSASVARVDKLMSLCGELEAGIARSQADSGRLMELVVSSVVAAQD